MRRRAAAAALLAAAVLAGCGEEEREPAAVAVASPAAEPVGEESQGSVVQYASCGDWRKGSRGAKQATVIQLRRQLTNQDSPTAESALSDERAFAILEKACSPSYAGSLRLYKLYVRAQAFAPLQAG